MASCDRREAPGSTGKHPQRRTASGSVRFKLCGIEFCGIETSSNFHSVSHMPILLSVKVPENRIRYNTIRRYKQSVKFVAIICVKFLLFQYLCGSELSTGRRKAEQTILIVAFVLSLVRGSARTTNIESVMKFAQLAPASRLVGVVSPACIRYNQALNQWCDGCIPQPASALTVTRVSENLESSPMCYMCSATQ